jgi:DNA-directed RNA polymerase subunit F
VNFEDNTVLVARGEKIADICPKCSLEVQGFITDSKNEFEEKDNVPKISIDEAKEILEKAGYRVYKKRYDVIRK